MKPTIRAIWLVALMLIAVPPACAMSEGDAPVSTEDDGEPGDIRQGATGSVVSTSGAAVAGAMIVVRSTDTPSRPVPELAVMSGEDGRFAWPLPPGRYELSALVGGRTGPAVAVTVPDGGMVRVELTAP